MSYHLSALAAENTLCFDDSTVGDSFTTCARTPQPTAEVGA